ncbi:MAG: transaldolase [Campylobacterales bacterium]|nr:transaldolase [Campylobacterales bacterium]
MYLSQSRFSLWADFIERDFLHSGFKALIDQGIINGATSNPSIFKSAFLTSKAYAPQLESLRGVAPKERYEALAISDIQSAADLLLPLYHAGDDGFVSIEVDPFLCDDALATIAEGKRLYAQIDRPNVMIKVPATEAGYKAMSALVGEGIAVNATLIFSKAQAASCARAFALGLERTAGPVATVISVFVSRFDRALDARLQTAGAQTALTGIYNAAAIYDVVRSMNVPHCRTLFASTGVKGDSLPGAYYVDALLAQDSVNTAPIATIEAFVAGGDRQIKLPLDAAVIECHFEAVAATGIDIDAEIEQLMNEGLDAFKTAFAEILEALKEQ